MKRAWASTLGWALALLLLCACAKETPAPEPVDVARLKSELKAELRAELKAEITAEVLRELRAPVTQLAAADEPPAGGAVGVRRPAAPSEDSERPGDPGVEPPPIRPAAGQGPADEPVDDPLGDAPAGDGPVEAEPGPDPSAEPLDPAIPAEPATGEGGLEVVRLLVAGSVDREHRLPVDVGTSFSVDAVSKVYAYVVVKNPGTDTVVGIEWQLDGKPLGQPLELKIGHSESGWRTWSTTRLTRRRTGKWVVRVLDPSQRELARADFTVR